MDKNIKVCKDCKYHVIEKEELPLYDRMEYYCNREKKENYYTDLVTGEIHKISKFTCRLERQMEDQDENENYCGYSGKYWEPKEIEPEVEAVVEVIGFWKWLISKW